MYFSDYLPYFDSHLLAVYPKEILLLEELCWRGQSTVGSLKHTTTVRKALKIQSQQIIFSGRTVLLIIQWLWKFHGPASMKSISHYWKAVVFNFQTKFSFWDAPNRIYAPMIFYKALVVNSRNLPSHVIFDLRTEFRKILIFWNFYTIREIDIP